MLCSNGGNRAIMGFEDGSVRIYPLENGDLGEMVNYWNMSIHDNTYGSISHIATSFDDKFLFTVGKDGNFFTMEIMDDETLKKEITDNKAKIPSAKVGNNNRE